MDEGYRSVENGLPVTRFLKRALLRTWLGVIGVILSITAALAITGIWEPLWDVYGWRVVASGIMTLIVFAYAGLQEFFRPPNPYGRLHPLYDMRDLGPAGELHSSELSWLWSAALLIGSAVALFVTTYWI